MKTRLMIVLFSVALVVSGCTAPHSHSTGWDYKVLEAYVASDVEKKLNQLAGEGWVVVSSSSTMDSNNSQKILVILKRHK